MYNTSRIILLVIIDIYATLSSISPNFNQEMGTKPGDKPEKGGRQPKSLRILYFSGLIVFTLLHIYRYGDDPITYWDENIFTIATLGFFLRMWCYYTLGHMFTFGLGIRKDHRLVTEGPYKWLVHPSYTGQAIVIIATAFFLKISFPIILVIAMIVSIKIRERTRKEEAMMQREFGDAYKQYISQRYRLLPYLHIR